MNNLHNYTSTPICRAYKHRETIDGVTIFYNLVNGVEEGRAEAIHPTHTINFKYVNGIKQGTATKFFPDKVQVRFQYINDVAINSGIIILPDGRQIEFP